MHSHIIHIYEYRTRAVKDKYTYHRRIKRIIEATDRYPPVPFQFQTCTTPENWGEIKTQRFGTYWFNQQDENVKRSFSRWNSRRSILNIHLCFYQTIPRPKNIHVSYARLRIQDIQIYRFKWFALCFIPFSLLFCFSSLRIFLSFLSFLRSNFLPSTPFFINSDLRSELSLSLSRCIRLFYDRISETWPTRSRLQISCQIVPSLPSSPLFSTMLPPFHRSKRVGKNIYRVWSRDVRS